VNSQRFGTVHIYTLLFYEKATVKAFSVGKSELLSSAAVAAVVEVEKKTMPKKTWREYENTARHLLNGFAEHFGLDKVEGKQKVVGQRSGTHWEIDAKGVYANGQDFVIVECREYKSSKQTQEQLGGLAYRIIDTGAKGGIIVTQLGLQEGAELVANAENVVPVHLEAGSTIHEYFLTSANLVAVGEVVNLDFKDYLTITVLNDDETPGKVLHKDKP
jgi:hypothetical protein